MHINLVVLNVPHDSRYSIQKNRTAAPEAGVDEIVELIPHEGVWGSGGQSGLNTRHPRGPRFAHPLPTAIVYTHNGKVRYAAEDKGLRIDITA